MPGIILLMMMIKDDMIMAHINNSLETIHAYFIPSLLPASYFRFFLLSGKAGAKGDQTEMERATSKYLNHRTTKKSSTELNLFHFS